MPPDEAARRFSAKGWDLSKGRRDRDVCPKCSAIKPIGEVKTMQTPNLTVVPANEKAEKPIEMSREDKRVIFAKLNEVYVDERIGYGDGWGDGRVSQDLGVPLAWVRLVREENFGPDASNDEIRGLIKQAQSCVSDIKSHVEQVARVRDGLDALFKQIKVLEAAATPLSMQANRIDGHIARIAKQVGLS